VQDDLFHPCGDISYPRMGKCLRFLYKEILLAKVSLILGKAEKEKLLSLIEEKQLVKPETVLPFDYRDDQGKQLSLVALRWDNLRRSNTQRVICEFVSALQSFEFCWADKKTVIHEGNFRFIKV